MPSSSSSSSSSKSPVYVGLQPDWDQDPQTKHPFTGRLGSEGAREGEGGERREEGGGRGCYTFW